MNDGERKKRKNSHAKEKKRCLFSSPGFLQCQQHVIWHWFKSGVGEQTSFPSERKEKKKLIVLCSQSYLSIRVNLPPDADSRLRKIEQFPASKRKTVQFRLKKDISVWRMARPNKLFSFFFLNAEDSKQHIDYNTYDTKKARLFVIYAKLCMIFH